MAQTDVFGSTRTDRRLTADGHRVTRYSALVNQRPVMLPMTDDQQSENVVECWDMFESWLSVLPYPTHLEREGLRAAWWFAWNSGRFDGFRVGLKQGAVK